MSFFKRLFGGSDDKGGPKPADEAKRVSAESKADAARTALHAQLLDSEKRLDELQKRVDKKTLEIKKLLAEGKKTQAMSQLKSKKMLEKQMDTVQNNSIRLQEQLNQLDTSTSTFTTLAALQQAAQAQKAQLLANNIEDAAEVLEEINETNQEMQEINEMLAQPTGLGVDLDDDDLMNELDEMNGVDLAEQLLSTGPVPTKMVPGAAAADSLPAVPTARVEEEEDEQAALDELQKEMGLNVA